MPKNVQLNTHFQKVVQPNKNSNLFLVYRDDNEESLTYGKLLKLAAVHDHVENFDESNCEDDIWRRMKNPINNKSTMPQYCILEGVTCFNENSKGWNLAKLSAQDSVIHALPEHEWMDGIHRPYVYLGMYGTSFSWHREDRNLMSINYLHYGSGKLWYTVPFEYADHLERVIQEEIEKIHSAKRSMLNIECNLVVRHKVVHVSPSFLKKHGIKFGKVKVFIFFVIRSISNCYILDPKTYASIYVMCFIKYLSNVCFLQVLQKPGEYIISFPGALHGGMNFGRNRAESVNFALPSTFSAMYDQFTYGTECR